MQNAIFLADDKSEYICTPSLKIDIIKSEGQTSPDLEKKNQYTPGATEDTRWILKVIN